VAVQILTGDCIPGAAETISLANQHDGLYSTVGCHPCRANEWEEAEAKGENYGQQLEELIVKGGTKVVAGEPRRVAFCGARPSPPAPARAPVGLSPGPLTRALTEWSFDFPV